MGWKSVEMQVALPRSQDAGKLQQQLLRQGQDFQASLTQHQLLQEELKRKQVAETEQLYRSKWEGEADKNTSEKFPNKRKDNKKKLQKYQHPYLGKQIDFNG
ncbi:hypothetical protein [Virgibacillus proomii]|uniref:hypothetical protein n=1 Tax=Virgibacillus proomii TaxID=84407 RepID=UPI0009844E78|nr:hypothetical protein [Virgibacillus proomii]